MQQQRNNKEEIAIQSFLAIPFLVKKVFEKGITRMKICP